MIDLHLHLLPGVDDGALDLDEAVAMCRQAAASGCVALVATPHQRHVGWWNTEVDRLEALRQQVERRVGPTPELFLGGEVRVDAELLGDLDRLREEGVLSLAGSSYLLLELDRLGLGPDPETVVHEVVVAGWRPIIAHPEFVPGIVRDPGLAERLVELGARLQVTAMTVTGGYGRPLQRLVERLFDAGLVHFVASDAHGLGGRPPGLDLAYRTIAGRWGEATARDVTVVNPRAVLDDRPLEGVDSPATARPVASSGRTAG